MKWDAYHCTIPAAVEEVQAELSRLYFTADFRPISGSTHGYDRMGGWFLGTVEVCRMYWGGNGGGVSLQVKGPGTPELVKRVRIIWPLHKVSRADVAVDLEYPGAWEDLSGKGRQIARERRLKLKEVLGYGDGDTVYMGSPRSVAYCRIYQKGKEQHGPDASPDWVRVELECKPGNSGAKEALSTLEPSQVFGATDWSQELSSYVGSLSSDRVKLGTVWRDPDTERTRRWLVTQCWEALACWADEVGGWQGLGRAMQEFKAEQVAMSEKERERLDQVWKEYEGVE